MGSPTEFFAEPDAVEAVLDAGNGGITVYGRVAALSVTRVQTAVAENAGVIRVPRSGGVAAWR